MTGYRLALSARADIIEILDHTDARFGAAARLRYEALLITALRDIAADPTRPGTLDRPELGAGARTWHLRGSRDRARTGSGTVRSPRHLLLFRIDPDATVVIARVLYDGMELARHLPAEQDWQ
jgi:toxin ParE1/3/4